MLVIFPSGFLENQLRRPPTTGGVVSEAVEEILRGQVATEFKSDMIDIKHPCEL